MTFTNIQFAKIGRIMRPARVDTGMWAGAARTCTYGVARAREDGVPGIRGVRRRMRAGENTRVLERTFSAQSDLYHTNVICFNE